MTIIMSVSTKFEVGDAVEREAKRLGLSKSKVIERALIETYLSGGGLHEHEHVEAAQAA